MDTYVMVYIWRTTLFDLTVLWCITYEKIQMVWLLPVTELTLIHQNARNALSGITSYLWYNSIGGPTFFFKTNLLK